MFMAPTENENPNRKLNRKSSHYTGRRNASLVTKKETLEITEKGEAEEDIVTFLERNDYFCIKHPPVRPSRVERKKGAKRREGCCGSVPPNGGIASLPLPICKSSL